MLYKMPYKFSPSENYRYFFIVLCGLFLTLLSACTSQPAREVNSGAPIYDCNFDIDDYFKNPSVRGYENRQGWMSWVSSRMQGGLLEAPGRKLYALMDRHYQNIEKREDASIEAVHFYIIDAAETKQGLYYFVLMRERHTEFVALSRDDYERFNSARRLPGTGRMHMIYCPLISDSPES